MKRPIIARRIGKGSVHQPGQSEAVLSRAGGFQFGKEKFVKSSPIRKRKPGSDFDDCKVKSASDRGFVRSDV